MLSLGALLHPSRRMRDDLRNHKPGPLLFPLAFTASGSAQHVRSGPGLTRAPLPLSLSRNIRVAVLPCSESTTCLFRTRPLDASDTLLFNEVFWVSMSYPALHQKTLRVDVCTTDQSHLEDCLVRAVSVCPSHLLSFWESVPLALQGEEVVGSSVPLGRDSSHRQTDLLGGGGARFTGGEWQT